MPFILIMSSVRRVVLKASREGFKFMSNIVSLFSIITSRNPDPGIQNNDIFADQILDTYTDDYNILTAHIEVIKMIKGKQRSLASLKSQLSNEQKKLNPCQTYIERKSCLNIIGD